MKQLIYLNIEYNHATIKVKYAATDIEHEYE